MKADICFSGSLNSHLAPLPALDHKAGKPKTRRPCRFPVAVRCRDDWACFQRQVFAQRVRGTRRSISEAVKSLRTSQAPGAAAAHGPAHENLVAILCSAGVSLAADSAAGPASAAMVIKIEPTMLRKAYPRMPHRDPHAFSFNMAWDDASVEEEVAEMDFEDWEDLAYQCPESRHASGFSEQIELRMQVELLRQNLAGFELTVDDALDELCAGLQSPCEQAKRRCDGIVQAFEQCGLRFHSVRKAWRLPRTGIPLIERPQDLVHAYP